MAIKAHLDPLSPSADHDTDRRAESRRALRLEAGGVLPGEREANVTIHNISAAGLLIETSLALETGEQITLALPEAGAVRARIAWRSDSLYGCAFAASLSAAALAAARLQGLPVTDQAGAQPQVTATPETLGARLGRLRREAGLTLADVANRLGVSKPTVWAWEKGKARPLPERTDAIARALGVEPHELAEPAGRHADVSQVIADCRTRIAQACNTTPGAVRIMIEL